MSYLCTYFSVGEYVLMLRCLVCWQCADFLHTEPNGQTKVLQQSQRNMLVLQTLLSFGLALRIRDDTFCHFM